MTLCDTRDLTLAFDCHHVQDTVTQHFATRHMSPVESTCEVRTKSMLLTQMQKMESLWSAETTAPPWRCPVSRGDVTPHRECDQGETGSHSLLSQAQKEAGGSHPDMYVTPPLDYLSVELRISEYNQGPGLSRRVNVWRVEGVSRHGVGR